MRVLHLVRTLSVGGIEPHIMTLSKGLMSAGWEVAIASDGGIGNTPHDIRWFEASGVRHYRVPFPGPGMPWWRLGAAASISFARLKFAVGEFCPDLIHVHYRATSTYAKGMQLLHGIPFVSTLHMTGIPCGIVHRTASFWGCRAIAISSEVREYLKFAFRVRDSRIRLIHNGADDTYFRPPSPAEKLQARRVLGVPPGMKVIAMIARMSREKGQDILLEAMARMGTQGQKSLALLAGVSIDGDTMWRDEIQARAARMGLVEYVRLLGFTETRTLLWASDVLVLPSRQEGFPMAIVESMLCGVVPIRTPAAGAREQIQDGTDGFIVPFDDSATLALRITSVLSEDNLRTCLGNAAVRKARRCFSAATMVSKTIHVYQEAVGIKAPHFI